MKNNCSDVGKHNVLSWQTSRVTFGNFTCDVGNFTCDVGKLSTGSFGEEHKKSRWRQSPTALHTKLCYKILLLFFGDGQEPV